MARLILDSVAKHFGAARAVDGVSLCVEDGEFLAVLGPSGCGKTTLLRLIAGFETVTEGAITVGGKCVSDRSAHVPPEERRMGIVFQSYALWPHMTVAGNVAYALKVQGLPKPERQARVAAALDLVGLADFADRPPALLSGGQRQRVALARCLAMEPALVLLDEPLANLDVHLRAAMQEEFARFHRRAGKTMLYITHDQAEAMALADRIAVMDQGRLLQVATPSILYREPSSAVVARFIGEGMVLPATVAGRAGAGTSVVEILGVKTTVRGQHGFASGAAAEVCLRAADLTLAETSDGAIPATLRRLAYQGGAYKAEAIADAAPGDVLTLDLPEPAAVSEGERIHIAIRGGWLLPPA
jgi:iron(III) transport system ATP-binding protein